MKTVRYEIQELQGGKWVTVSRSSPTVEGQQYSLNTAQELDPAGTRLRVIEVLEQQKLIWPDVGACGAA